VRTIEHKNTQHRPQDSFRFIAEFLIFLATVFGRHILVWCFDSTRKKPWALWFWPVENTQIMGIFNLSKNSHSSKPLGCISCNNRDVTTKNIIMQSSREVLRKLSF